MSASVDAIHILGMGCVKSGDVERMLILTNIEALTSSVEMGFMDGKLRYGGRSPRTPLAPVVMAIFFCHVGGAYLSWLADCFNPAN